MNVVVVGSNNNKSGEIDRSPFKSSTSRQEGPDPTGLI